MIKSYEKIKLDKVMIKFTIKMKQTLYKEV